MKPDFNTFSERTELVIELAKRIGNLLTWGIRENGRASLAVSGGSTPVALFEHLSNLDIPWPQVSITLVDERWVDPSEPDSNEHLLKTRLLKNKAAAATFIGMKNKAATASAGESECEQQLQNIPRPFDVLILGMGNDGHTASLFPGAEKLPQATGMNSGKACIGIAPLTAPHERMTLTLPAILDSKQVFLHITGQGKRDVLQQAQADGPIEEMPIRFILQQQTTPVSIYWAP
jgi:6-phosphogluconolactonase